MEYNGFIITNNEPELQLEIEANGEKAYMVYRFHQSYIALMHTFVPPALNGLGIGDALARAAFQYARELNKPVLVYCPFVAAFVQKHPEFDVQVHKKEDNGS